MLCFWRPSFSISRAVCFFPHALTLQEIIQYVYCSVAHNTTKERAEFCLLWANLVWLYTQWCAEVARQRGRLVEKNCLSMWLKWTHTHLELLNLISAVLFVLLCTLKWKAGWLWSAPPIHQKGQTDEMQACYGPINLILPPPIMTAVLLLCLTTDYTLALPTASHAITLYKHRTQHN